MDVVVLVAEGLRVETEAATGRGLRAVDASDRHQGVPRPAGAVGLGRVLGALLLDPLDEALAHLDQVGHDVAQGRVEERVRELPRRRSRARRASHGAVRRPPSRAGHRPRRPNGAARGPCRARATVCSAVHSAPSHTAVTASPIERDAVAATAVVIAAVARGRSGSRSEVGPGREGEPEVGRVGLALGASPRTRRTADRRGRAGPAPSGRAGGTGPSGRRSAHRSGGRSARRPARARRRMPPACPRTCPRVDALAGAHRDRAQERIRRPQPAVVRDDDVQRAGDVTGERDRPVAGGAYLRSGGGHEVHAAMAGAVRPGRFARNGRVTAPATGRDHSGAGSWASRTTAARARVGRAAPRGGDRESQRAAHDGRERATRPRRERGHEPHRPLRTRETGRGRRRGSSGWNLVPRHHVERTGGRFPRARRGGISGSVRRVSRDRARRGGHGAGGSPSCGSGRRDSPSRRARSRSRRA